MPQISGVQKVQKGSWATGLGQLAGGLMNMSRRRDEAEKKGLEEQRKLQKEQLVLLEKYRPNDPRIDVLVDSLLKIGGMPTPARSPLQQQELGFRRAMGAPAPIPEGALEAQRARQMGWPTPAEKAQQQTLEISRARAAGTVAGKPPKGPSAGTISRYYAARDKFQKEVDAANEKIDFMRSDWKLDPGELPRKRKDLDNWNRVNNQLATAQASLDSLRQQAIGAGIDLTIGERTIPTPEQVTNMTDDEILRGLGGWNR